MIILKIIFWISLYVIFWAMIGYPISLKLIGKIFCNKENRKDYKYQPTVTLLIVAHNEEKVILDKLNNAISLNYSSDKLEILVSSDNSTDNTNDIVKKFIKENQQYKIKLYEVKERKGKTNAQNEAQKLVKSEILVMTDANSIFEKNAIKELVSSFTSEEIVYVCGKLDYINKENETSQSESTYWNIDLEMRETESKIQTITAGNGAIYACRTKDYHEFEPIECHDSAMPFYYAMIGKRAIFNKEAIAYEKAGENDQDEFKRKVRMNRDILQIMFRGLRALNIFKYKWFSYFYFGHRTCRQFLWTAHIMIFIASFILIQDNILYLLAFLGQIIIYAMAIIGSITKKKNKIVKMTFYYCMTVFAQVVGVKNILTGQAKPFWEKAESTR